MHASGHWLHRHLEQFRELPLPQPRNPKLPPYDGSADPVRSVFSREANPAVPARILADNFLAWTCQQVFHLDPHKIAHLLKQRFRSHAYLFELDQKIRALEIREGQFTSFLETFMNLMSQARMTSEANKLFAFVKAIRPSYREAVLFENGNTLAAAVEMCRRKAASNQPSGGLQTAQR